MPGSPASERPFSIAFGLPGPRRPSLERSERQAVLSERCSVTHPFRFARSWSRGFGWCSRSVRRASSPCARSLGNSQVESQGCHGWLWAEPGESRWTVAGASGLRCAPSELFAVPVPWAHSLPTAPPPPWTMTLGCWSLFGTELSLGAAPNQGLSGAPLPLTGTLGGVTYFVPRDPLWSCVG